MTDLSTGKITRKNNRIGPAPSMMAASSSSRGTVEMNAWNSSTLNDRPYAISTRISPVIVSNRPNFWRTQIVGTTAGGTIRPASIKVLMIPRSLLRRRCSTNATIAPKITIAVTLTTVRMVLLMKATTMM